MNTMQYKGYTAVVHFSDEDDILWGTLVGLRDSISFEGDSVASLRKDFQDAVDDYLDSCDEWGKTPDKPPSGNIRARIAPAVHGAALDAAALAHKPFNQWLESLIARECGVTL